MQTENQTRMENCVSLGKVGVNEKQGVMEKGRVRTGEEERKKEKLTKVSDRKEEKRKRRS